VVDRLPDNTPENWRATQRLDKLGSWQSTLILAFFIPGKGAPGQPFYKHILLGAKSKSIMVHLISTSIGLVVGNRIHRHSPPDGTSGV